MSQNSSDFSQIKQFTVQSPRLWYLCHCHRWFLSLSVRNENTHFLSHNSPPSLSFKYTHIPISHMGKARTHDSWNFLSLQKRSRSLASMCLYIVPFSVSLSYTQYTALNYTHTLSLCLSYLYICSYMLLFFYSQWLFLSLSLANTR